jgi:signal transduction histidine kinase/ABC-type uncharacterized transport system substrate-binding protein
MRVFFQILALAASCLLLPIAGAMAQPKRVTILQSYGVAFKPWSEYAKALRQELETQSPWPLEVQEFAVSTARSDDVRAEGQFARYLDAIYPTDKPDLIVAFGASAAMFVQRHRADLFPSTPMILTAVEERRVEQSALTENDAVVAVRQEVPKLFGNILRLLPDTQTIAVAIGNSPNERFWIEEIRRELSSFDSRIKLVFYNDLSFQQMLHQLASLPPRSAIWWMQPQVDALGITHEGERAALKTLYAAANAPIFSYDDSFFAGEIVGGPMTSAAVTARTTAQVAIRVLKGEKPADITTSVIEYGPSKYDWRQLKRWAIPEARLLPGSEIHFREPSLWEAYRRHILSAGAVFLVQGALIGGLLLERSRRLRAEMQARQRMAELARLNRYSVVGELTASIAHEINQPLGAIVVNAETAELITKSPKADWRELAEILGDIRRDGHRATDVIRRLRGLLGRMPVETKNIDLNQLVQDTSNLLSGYLAGRKTRLSTLIARAPVIVRGDSIQLQQVIINLVVNSVEAMSAVPAEDREVTIQTAVLDGFGKVTVTDKGPGISADRLEEVFEPLFTTKAEGMGMGLAIARTIIKAHDGRIWAESLDGAGARFHIMLPFRKAAADFHRAT